MESFRKSMEKIEKVQELKVASGTVKLISDNFHAFKKQLRKNETPILEVILIDGNRILPTSLGALDPYLIRVIGHLNGNVAEVIVPQNMIQVIMTKIEQNESKETSENVEFMYQ